MAKPDENAKELRSQSVPEPDALRTAPERPIERDAAGRVLPGSQLHLSHGASRFRATGELPAHTEHVGQELDALITDYVNDLGGREAVTTGQRELLELLRTAAGMRRLVELELQRTGWKTVKGRVRAATHLLLSLLDKEEHLIRRLGVDRKAKPINTLESYARELAAKKEALR